MAVESLAAVTFNGNSNVMKSNTAPSGQGKSIYSESTNIEFSVCKPVTTSPGTISGHLEVDYNGCPIELCTWHAETDGGVAAGTTGTHLVPAIGCKMSKRIDVRGDLTINGESGSYHQLQSNRVDNQGVAASDAHRHFYLHSTGKLTLNYLKLTWGESGSIDHGGFIYMKSGILAINWVHFDGTKTTGTHTSDGGCIRVNGGTVTIKKSTFEGFRASRNGGAMYVWETSTAMTIASTTFKNNEATVRLNSLAFIKFTFFTSFVNFYF